METLRMHYQSHTSSDTLQYSNEAISTVDLEALTFEEVLEKIQDMLVLAGYAFDAGTKLGVVEDEEC